MNISMNKSTLRPAPETDTESAAQSTSQVPGTTPRMSAPHAEPQIIVPTHAEIARRAYKAYLESNCEEGRCEANWKQAEQSIRDQNHAAHK